MLEPRGTKMNKKCSRSLRFWRPYREDEVQADMWPRRGTPSLWTSPAKRFWHLGDESLFKYLFFYQMEKAVLNMEDSIRPGKSIFYWLSPEGGGPSCSQRNNSVMGLWSWLMVNGCFNTGKQMNIWRTPGCEFPREAVLLLTLRVPNSHSQKLILPFSEEAAYRAALSSPWSSLHLQFSVMCALHCIPFIPPLHDLWKELHGWVRK